jgi:hypothetical protein
MTRTWDAKTGKRKYVGQLTDWEVWEQDEESWYLGQNPAFADLPPNSDLTNVVAFPRYYRWLRNVVGKLSPDDFRQLN